MSDRHPDTVTWWRHRRRHSYLGVFGLFGLAAVGLLMDPARLAAAVPLFQTLAWIFGIIILTYVIAATAEDSIQLWQKK